MNTRPPTQPTPPPIRTSLRKLFTRISAPLGVFWVVGFGLARSASGAETPVSEADRQFLLASAQDGLTEVKLGELAARQGQRDDVKELGRVMVKDHTSLNDTLKALTAEKNVPWPARLDERHQKMVDRLAARHGEDFDVTYLVDLSKVYERQTRKFKTESAATQDPEIKMFVDTALPVVDEHHKRCDSLQK